MATGSAAVEQTQLQQSIFNAPPPKAAQDNVMKDAPADENRGQKRTRNDEDEESDEDMAMDEDSDAED